MNEPNNLKDFNVDKIFTYHRPTGDQQRRYQSLRNLAKDFAWEIMASCPQSRERSLALTNLQQTVMWANASIACNEPDAEDYACTSL